MAPKRSGDQGSGTSPQKVGGSPKKGAKPRGRAPVRKDKDGSSTKASWDPQNERWEVVAAGGRMFRRPHEKEWTLEEDNENAVPDALANELRAELLEKDWTLLKDVSAAALHDMCAARGIRVQGTNKKRDTEEKRHKYYLDKLLKWLKVEKVKAEADATLAVDALARQLRPAQQQGPKQASTPGPPQDAPPPPPPISATTLASRIGALQPEQRRAIENTVRVFEQSNDQLRATDALRRDAEGKLEVALVEIEDLKGTNAELEKKLVAAQKKWGANLDKIRKKKTHAIPEDGFMSTASFAKVLDANKLLTKCRGAAHEGQHVFHIIANSKGGPDHVDNYLYALGGTFNIAIGDRLDHVNCYLAGLEKTRLAVRIALKVEGDENLHKHLTLRNKKEKRIFFREGHADFCARATDPDEIAAALFKAGANAFRDIRLNERNRTKLDDFHL